MVVINSKAVLKGEEGKRVSFEFVETRKFQSVSIYCILITRDTTLGRGAIANSQLAQKSQ